ncbi:MAG: NAD(P)-binding domain-containing protein [Anaerolineae bacterium]|nr:NAD(P)-binding domain-containing protein [Anaerolineae bacterium]
MPLVYHEEDGSLDYLNDKLVGVVGYGNLGRPMALNLHDSGISVLVSESDADRRRLAEEEGFTLASTADLVRQADIVMLLVPDEVMPQLYLDQVSPNLERGGTLVFASSYNIAFGYIEAPPFVDVGLLAPRTLGVAVRERYLADRGFFSFVAVGQDASGEAWNTVLALAKAVGSLRMDAGAIEIAFEREAELDLFVQQAVLPMLHHVLVTAAEILTEAGYPPEVAFTDLYLSGELQDVLERASREGLFPALRLASLTSQYGTFSRLERFNDLKLNRLMEVTLDEIRSGAFAREWAKEYGDGYHRLRKLLRAQSKLDLWQLEQQAIDMLNPTRDADDSAFDL